MARMRYNGAMRITPAMTKAMEKLDECGHLSDRSLRRHGLATATMTALVRYRLVKAQRNWQGLAVTRYELTDEGRGLLK